MRKGLVSEEKVIGIYKFFVPWFGGACSFSSFAVHFQYINLEYLVFRIIADVIIKGSLGIRRS
jgi:hypothetical protein